MVKRSFVFMAALAALFAAAAPARAADPPRWVAAIFVEAQRAVGMRWSAVPGATGYKVLRSETAGSGHVEIAAPAQPQHFDTAVEPGSTYFYVLQSVAGGAPSANSDEKSVTIPGQKAKKLLAPTWAKVTPQESTEFGKTTYKVGLVWNRNPDAVAYNLYRSLAPGKDREMISSVSETQYVDAAVEVGKTYYYALTALDGSFTETPFSDEQKAEIVKKAVAEVKAKIKLKPVGRASKKLWNKVRGADNGDFDYWEPYDIEYSAGSNTVIAGSTNTHEVYVLNAATGALVAVFGSRGVEPGQFIELLGIGLDADDNIVACDRGGKKLIVFSQSGKVIREHKPVLPASYTAQYPNGPGPIDAAVDFKTGDIYVADKVSGMLIVLDEKGKFQRFIGEKGTPGEMHSPMFLRFDKDNHLIALDMAATQISTFDLEGKLLNRWGINKATVEGFVFIGPFDFDAAGNLAVLDRSSNTLRGYNPDSRYLYNLANEKNDGAAELYLPKAVAIDPKTETVFVAEGLINRIQAFKMIGPIPAPQAALGESE